MTGLEGLDAEQLKERLLVAETMMKKLYNRNKELEEYHTSAIKQFHNYQKDNPTAVLDQDQAVDHTNRISDA